MAGIRAIEINVHCDGSRRSIFQRLDKRNVTIFTLTTSGNMCLPPNENQVVEISERRTYAIGAYDTVEDDIFEDCR